MNKTQLAKTIAGTTGFSEKDTEKIIDATLKVITDTMKADEEVMLTGFGTFQARIRHARAGVNPQNPSEKIQIPEVRVPKFKAGKALKDALKEKGETASEASEKPAEESKPEASEPAESGDAQPRTDPRSGSGAGEPETPTE